MKWLVWLKAEAVKAWKRCEPLLLFIVLAGAPLAMNLSEPRTFAFEGYHAAAGAPLAWGIVGVAILLLALRSAIVPPPRVFRIACGALALVGLVWGGHSVAWSVALALLAASGLAALWRTRHVVVAKAADVATFCGVALGGILTADFVHEQVLTGLDLRGTTASLLSRLFPGQFGVTEGVTLTSVSDGHISLVQIASDRLGGVHIVALLAVLLAVSALRRRPAKAVVIEVAAVLLYGVIAGAYLMLRWSGNPERPWTDEEAWAFAFLPLCAWLTTRILVQPILTERRTWRWGGATALAGCLLFTAGATLWGPSQTKSGRVVMDEAHGDWETAKLPLDDRLFGGYTVYNYRNLYQELQRVFGAELAEKELSREELRGVSVLILKTPTKPYSNAFCDAVVEFARNGGGVWLIGDHTDAFGMSTYLNKIANRLGVDFRKNAWFEPPVKRNLWRPDSFTDPVAGDLSTFLFYTGCEVRVPITDKKLMVARRNVIEDADYSAGSFFGDLRAVPENNGGNVAMATLGQRGRGRLAVWSDSTLFSNFSIYTPGKIEIAFNTMEWLRRENRMPMFRTGLMAVGALLALVGLLTAGGASFVIAGLVAIALVPVANRLNRNGTKVWRPEESQVGRTVAFYEPAKSPHLPVYVSIDKALAYHYLSSFVSTQRVGGRPFVAESASAATRARTIVAIPHTIPVEPGEIEQLGKWTAQGGDLIVWDAGNDNGRFVQEIFASQGGKSPMAPWREKAERGSIVDFEKDLLGEYMCAPLPKCPEPWLTRREGKAPIAGWFPLGKGRVFVSSSATLFSDEAAGYVLDIPTKPQFGVLRAMCRIYRNSLTRDERKPSGGDQAL